MEFISSCEPPAQDKGPAWWFVFSGFSLLTEIKEQGAQVPLVRDVRNFALRLLRKGFLGTLAGIPCYWGECRPEEQPLEGMAFQGLRRLYGVMDDAVFWAAGRALLIMNWERTHQYCSQCGGAMVDKEDERGKYCLQCGLTSFPRMSPAVIVAVLKENRILLARAARFPAGMYSVLAGFVEPGETLEDCVRREIREEVGVEVENIRYFGSQPWPFPNSLMIGFTADYAGGEMKMDKKEIVDAGWFSPADMPTVPDKISIARRLIDWFVERHAEK